MFLSVSLFLSLDIFRWLSPISFEAWYNKWPFPVREANVMLMAKKSSLSLCLSVFLSRDV